MSKKVLFGELLRDSRKSGADIREIDGLLNFKYLASYESEPIFQLDKGINTPRAVKCVDGSERRPAIIVTSSPHKKGSVETPWQDYFDLDNGHIRYFGDNKDPGKDPARAPGNKALLDAFSLAHSHDPAVRASTPPIIFFQRQTYKGKSKGFPQFSGIGVIRSVDLVTQWDNKLERTFTNYAFDFVVLKLDKEHEIFDWNWIDNRRNPRLGATSSLQNSPESWRSWIKEGVNSLEKLRRRVSKLSIESANNQRTVIGSETHSVLERIYKYYSGKKHHFEGLAEIIAERVVDSNRSIYRRGWITSASNDGGTDFVAALTLGSSFSKVQLVILGQAKCVSPDIPTGGNHIARLVARLRRGWLGVYVTTSYFSEKVQQEVIEDEYPIVLIHGKRVAEEVVKILHESDIYISVEEYLDHLSSQYHERIRQRRPEEVLQT